MKVNFVYYLWLRLLAWGIASLSLLAGSGVDFSHILFTYFLYTGLNYFFFICGTKYFYALDKIIFSYAELCIFMLCVKLFFHTRNNVFLCTGLNYSSIRGTMYRTTSYNDFIFDSAVSGLLSFVGRKRTRPHVECWCAYIAENYQISFLQCHVYISRLLKTRQ